MQIPSVSSWPTRRPLKTDQPAHPPIAPLGGKRPLEDHLSLAGNSIGTTPVASPRMLMDHVLPTDQNGMVGVDPTTLSVAPTLGRDFHSKERLKSRWIPPLDCLGGAPPCHRGQSLHSVLLRDPWGTMSHWMPPHNWMGELWREEGSSLATRLSTPASNEILLCWIVTRGGATGVGLGSGCCKAERVGRLRRRHECNVIALNSLATNVNHRIGRDEEECRMKMDVGLLKPESVGSRSSYRMFVTAASWGIQSTSILIADKTSAQNSDSFYCASSFQLRFYVPIGRRKKGGPQRTTPAPSLGPLIGSTPVRGLMDTATILQRTAVVHRVSIVELKTLLLISCKFRISGAKDSSGSVLTEICLPEIRKTSI
ncbi:unnamed protein product [Cyprideis torosa]|uniref:Uncharacterized protein n=1 Tax=Cyprideis torosa TaxID=163714 RepID=A0A7R8WKV3_9CRUS|nr:unnamed protein product [Cyprideis torosa]CAG0897508.1 unnamed protein product [Cyprideis torosa]